MSDSSLTYTFSHLAQQLGAGHPRQTSVPTPGRLTLSSGTPDFPTPAHIVAAAHRALDAGYTSYTPWAGLPKLREAIAAKLLRDNGITADPASEILVTSGTQEALLVILQTLLGPGDEVLVHEPYYDQYRRDAMIAGGRLVTVPTSEADAFAIDPERMEAAITPRTRAIMVVSPSNPSGTVQPRAVLEQVAAIAQKHNLLVIADELYEKYVYENFKHHSIASFPGMWERTITINGVSKCYSMTGFRVGYIAAPAQLIHAMLPLKHSMTICAPSIAQWAALAAITGSHNWFTDVLTEYDLRRRFWMQQLDEMQLSYGYPQGAYYLYINISSTGLVTSEFSRRMAEEYDVIIGSGGAYGETRYVRGSLATPLDTLQTGLARMAEAVAHFRREHGTG